MLAPCADGGAPIRLIKRHVNRNLYDTGTGTATSLRGIEELVRAGVDIRVIDERTGEDLTGEVLVRVLANTVGNDPTGTEIPLLTTLIRAPDELLAAMVAGDRQHEELETIGERVRVLSSTIDALVRHVEQQGNEPSREDPWPSARTL